jgi:hypothetical protein
MSLPTELKIGEESMLGQKSMETELAGLVR